ncbi:Protein of unknown function (DUF445) [Acididesulfobacillus acetoxydans]|uniref:DUF445 domain-containing protein n=1 Tax=Acididesulfobacillus acetoxydans TaxID=1561005 RepID=A0A8S0VW58_9FIRM|nr:DUF445 domain-containing protein [Acididesulfobacillus acetoxydans]CAA7600463.1 Protein of unknown function (DUF445) [Acididesulfobacillus acetoxydans]CEJ06597.1 Protein of unknown function (DUF445) [Acididesulfobacillus acetoxydans]
MNHPTDDQVQTEISRNYSHWATLTLALVSVGFLVSYPFRADFWGGLISTACRAGMLAGLADWFAVTALFRRPLGIRPGRVLRTEIIPRNRERLFEALADMVENDLLSKKALKERLTHYNSAAFLLDYLSQPQILAESSSFLADLARDLTGQTEPQALINFLEGLTCEEFLFEDLTPLLVEALNLSEKKGYVGLMATFANRSLLTLVDSPQLKQALALWLQKAYQTYEAGNTARKLVDTFLPSAGELAADILEQLRLFLTGPEAQELLMSWVREYAGELVSSRAARINLSQSLFELVRHIIGNKLLSSNGTPPQPDTPFGTQGPGNDKVSSAKIATSMTDGDTLKLLIEDIIREIVITRRNPEWEANLDGWLKDSLLRFIDTQHAIIGRMVRQNLEPLSNERLVELIESRAGNDLQMIRINGSVVGSLAGSLIYLVNFLIQQKW